MKSVVRPDVPVSVNEAEHYFRALLRCETGQQVADVTSAATRDLAPNQLRNIYGDLGSVADPDLLELLKANANLWMVVQRKKQAVYDNVRLATRARLFRSPGVSRARKVLLIAFAGVGGDMFITTTRLLMRLPVGRFDVLWLWPADDMDYPTGVPGFGNSFLNVCNNLQKLLPGYGGVAALGGSLGGFAALRAALLLDLPAGVSLSGRFSALRWKIGRSDTPDFDPLCGCLRPARTSLTAYYSANHAQDAAQAAKLAALNPRVRLIPRETHNHNVLAQMLADGTFDGAFERIYESAMMRGRGAAVAG